MLESFTFLRDTALAEACGAAAAAASAGAAAEAVLRPTRARLPDQKRRRRERWTGVTPTVSSVSGTLRRMPEMTVSSSAGEMPAMSWKDVGEPKWAEASAQKAESGSRPAHLTSLPKEVTSAMAAAVSSMTGAGGARRSGVKAVGSACAKPAS